MKVLVTGANGFVGAALCHYVEEQGHEVVPIMRHPAPIPNARVLMANDDAGWQDALKGCDSIVHLAGRAHVMHEREADPLAVFREANVETSITLARRAADAGVRRLVFASSIKVNGEQTQPGHSFRPDDNPNPSDNYALSKWEAEQALREIARSTGLEVVIVRLPLVYGPGVKGNFASLISLVKKGLPLPLGAINNQRSMIGLDNLNSFLLLCAAAHLSPKAADQVFLVSDGEPVSTTELLRKLSKAYGRPSRLLPVPPRLISLCANLMGQSGVAERLLGSLVVDDSKAREWLGWHPQTSIDAQLQGMVMTTEAKTRGSVR